MPYYKQPLSRLCTLESIYSVWTRSEEVTFIRDLCHNQADWAQPFSSVSPTCVDPIHHAIVLSWSELATTQSYHYPPSPDKDSLLALRPGFAVHFEVVCSSFFCIWNIASNFI